MLRDSTITLADGRRLAYAEWGDPDGKPIFAPGWDDDGEVVQARGSRRNGGIEILGPPPFDI